MAEDDWMTADAGIPQSKFVDEDKPEEKKEAKVKPMQKLKSQQKEEPKESKTPKKKTIDQLAAERQQRLVLSETEMKALDEKYKSLPEKERVLK